MKTVFHICPLVRASRDFYFGGKPQRNAPYGPVTIRNAVKFASTSAANPPGNRFLKRRILIIKEVNIPSAPTEPTP